MPTGAECRQPMLAGEASSAAFRLGCDLVGLLCARFLCGDRNGLGFKLHRNRQKKFGHDRIMRIGDCSGQSATLLRFLAEVFCFFYDPTTRRS